MGFGNLIKTLWGTPEWELPNEEDVSALIVELDEKIKAMPKCPEKTKLIYMQANQMQILRIILAKKKKSKIRPDAEGRWVWIPDEEYEGRKYK